MSERSFPVEQRIQNGRAHSSLIVKCRKCDGSDFMVRGSGKASTSNAQKYFQRRGWEIGRGPHMDICPLCAKPPKRIHSEKPKLVLVPKVESMEMKADKPREMTREDRQRIHAAIGEHYLENGYAPPWTDKLKAEDLKVPAAWVTEIRDQFFGPEGSNLLYDKYLEDIAAWADMYRKLEVHLKQADELRALGAELDVMRRKIENDLKGRRA